MRAILAWFKRLTGMLGSARRDRELARELEAHIQIHVEEGGQRGLTPRAARRDALMKLGGLEQAKERYRDRRGFPGLETAAKDLGYAACALRSDKPFTITA